MKKVAVTVAVLALGLAACEPRTEENATANEVAVENEAMNDVGDAAENALDAASNEVNAIENAAENAGEAIENAAENATE